MYSQAMVLKRFNIYIMFMTSDLANRTMCFTLSCHPYFISMVQDVCTTLNQLSSHPAQRTTRELDT